MPTLDVPKGGGAMRGIDEKLTTNPVTGSAALTIPLPVSPARALTPELALAYDAGTGNGPFGAGLSLHLPAVSRRTDKGVPRYDDDVDVFVIAGAEDLVPYLEERGDRWERVERTEGAYVVRRYRPRIDGAYARIEHWQWIGASTDAPADADHWRMITPSNVTHRFGTTPASRLADPVAPSRIFSWALTEVHDDRDNHALYEYVIDDDRGVDAGDIAERGRIRSNHYLKRVRWGNRIAAPAVARDWCFTLVLDYGDEASSAWPARRDAFSSYRAGFELRTHRLCQRALLYHQFDDLGADPVLVRRLEFDYDDDPALAHLRSATAHSHDATGTLSLPPLTLTWTTSELGREVLTLDDDATRNLPAGIDGAHAWVDLGGEGLAGALYETGQGLAYQRNLGGGRFAALQTLADAPVPSLAGGLQFGDPEHRGQAALVAWSGPLAGYRYRDGDRWEPFSHFSAVPTQHDDPHARLLDVDGDGLADLVVTEHEALRIYPSLGVRGFGPAENVPYPTDAGGHPTFVFADRDHSIFLADMSGDGLTDVVRIRNGEVCYWPNLGHGRFGPRVTMGFPAGHAFDRSDDFDPQRLRLADLDGSGPTDLIYLSGVGVTVWRNLAGNRLAPPERLAVAPAIDRLSSVAVLDLEGDGTGCLVWSAGLAADGRRPVRYLRLSSDPRPDAHRSCKPHLLSTVDNGLGATTDLEYTTSTRSYLDDEAAGRPWATRLPFPVHVVAQVVRTEGFTGTRQVTRFAYHHGCWDPIEREFRGFGLVETWDGDEYDARHRGDPLQIAPKHTRTWSHPGVLGRAATLDAAFRAEWATGLPLLGAHEVPDAVDAEEIRTATRALKHRPLREEVFADDDGASAARPYVVTQHRYRTRRLQPADGSFPACFAVDELESLACHTERIDGDPRIAHTLNLEIDRYGRPTAAVAVVYPRTETRREEDQQGLVRAVLTRQQLADLDESLPSRHRLGVPIEATTWELTELGAPSEALYSAAELRAALAQVRLVSAERHQYQADLADDQPLALGDVESKALPYASYQLAFTAAHLDDLTPLTGGDRAGLVALLTDGGYVEQPLPRSSAPAWWITQGRAVLDRHRFYLPTSFVDPFGATTTATYDDDHILRELIGPEAIVSDATTRNATAIVRYDHRHLAATRVRDPNGNEVEVALDARGAVTARAILGRPGALTGDTLAAPTERFSYQLDHLPTSARVLTRVVHGSDGFEEAVSYFDGLGRTLMTKHSSGPGVARVIVDGEVRDALVAERWIGTGRVVCDNKGEPVKQYEPYYADSDRWDDDPRLDAVRPSSVIVRDPLGRVIKTLHQDGSYAEVTFSPWHERHADENHTAATAGWTPVVAGVPQLDAHATEAMTNLRGAPGRTVLDTLGRPVVAIAYDQTRAIPTRTRLDVAGDPLAVTIAVAARDGGGTIELEVRSYAYDLARRAYREDGVDDGRKLSLVAVDGKPLRMRTARGYVVATDHDPLRRVETVRVTPPTGDAFTAERHVYGETAPTDAQTLGNLRGKPWRLRDATGETVFTYDHAGNAVMSERRVFAALGEAVNVDAALPFTTDVFVTRTDYDALARVTAQQVAPDPRRQTRTYGRDGRLASVALDGAAVATLVHDARGLRESITYGNGIATRYGYDERTLRLASLATLRGTETIQDYRYGYDAAGNILWTDDRAQPVLFHANRELRARSQYWYDGLNRLIGATGREHKDQNAGGDQVVVPGVPSVPGDAMDPQRMQMYEQTYVYDDAGNILEMAHAAGGVPRWRRVYRYAYDLPASMGVSPSSQLWSTGVRGDATRVEPLRDYEHDDHGNMVAMPSLPAMAWDWREAMVQSSVAAGGERGAGGVAYACDAAGQRVWKQWTGTGSEVTRTERLYLGMLEVYREYRGAALTLERRSVHVMDDERRVLLAEEDLAIDGDVASDVVVARLYRYQLDDHLGSSRMELGGETSLADATVLSVEEFHPYGTSAWSATDARLGARPKRYRFTGMERDAETGLALHGVRYYAPWLGRWTSADPEGLPTYNFAALSPTQYVDNTGRAPTTPTFSDDVRISIQHHESLMSTNGMMLDGGRVPGLSPRPDWGAFTGGAGYFQQKVASAERTLRNKSASRKDLSNAIGTLQVLGPFALLEDLVDTPYNVYAGAIAVGEGAARTHILHQRASADTPVSAAVLAIDLAILILEVDVGTSSIRTSPGGKATPAPSPPLDRSIAGSVRNTSTSLTSTSKGQTPGGLSLQSSTQETQGRLFPNLYPDHEYFGIRGFSIDQAKQPTFTREVLYVVTADGQLILGAKGGIGEGGHIDLARGAPVLAAGHAKIVNGQLKWMNNKSGHYRPNGTGPQRAAEEAFSRMGFNTSGAYKHSF